MNVKVARIYENTAVFPIVYTMKDLEKVFNCPNTDVILTGRMLNILNVKRVIQHIKNNGKTVIVDIDLVSGLGHEEYGVDFIAKEVGADGIISTHRSTVWQARKKKLITILKVFAYDNYSLDSAFNTIEQCEPDIVELLPAVVLPLIMDKIKNKTNIPVNASGIMDHNQDKIKNLFDIGVAAIHTSNQDLWGLAR